MRILYFGDIYGSCGRKAVKSALPYLIEKHRPDFIGGNAENLAGGKGVNRNSLSEMWNMGFQCFTSGNHIWDNKEVFEIMPEEDRLLRPANYPSTKNQPCPGIGHRVFEVNGQELVVINLLGRTFMDSVDCPFQAIDSILADYPNRMPILVDMHCDATSEATAMGWFLSGRVSAVLGSHSHVQTSDERILPGGTGYITDIGLSGSFDSCIGIEPEGVIERFITRRKVPYQPAQGNPGVACVFLEIDADGKTQKIIRERFTLEEKRLPGIQP